MVQSDIDNLNPWAPVGWRSMIGNAAFETGIARVDMESRRMTSVATVMLLNILIGWHLTGGNGVAK